MIEIDDNIADIERQLSDVARRQVPFALALALNDAAEDAREAATDAMKRSFDAPTRFTLNALMVRRARKTKPVAVLELKPAQRGRHYLRVQADGGVRPQTGFEKLLGSRLKYAGIIQTVTPAKGARLNKFGNMSPGQRNQVLSAVQAQRDASANTSADSRARAPGRSQYFVPRPGSKLSPGVWERRSKKGKIRKVLHFSAKNARYRKRWDFERIGEGAARRTFRAHFYRRLREAMATAR